MPHPSPIPLFKLSGLFKLPAPLTILASLPFSLLRLNSGIFLASATCLKATGNIPDTFSIRRDRKQTTVGECHGKKFGCKFGALQRAFRQPAFLRQGGDALSPKWKTSSTLLWLHVKVTLMITKINETLDWNKKSHHCTKTVKAAKQGDCNCYYWSFNKNWISKKSSKTLTRDSCCHFLFVFNSKGFIIWNALVF